MAVAIVEGRNDLHRREHNNRSWQTWHGAVLPNQRRMPDLKTLMIPDPKARQQTWQEQMRIARMITVAYGGTVH
jgi:hypothetical protein